MTELATPFRPFAAVAATVVSRAFAPSRVATPKLRSVPRRRIAKPAETRGASNRASRVGVLAADEALRLAVGRTLAQRVVDFFNF